MKQIGVLLTLLLLVSLNACGTKNSAPTPTTAVPTRTEASAESTGQAEYSGKVLIVYFAVAQNSEVDAISSASVATVNGEAKGLVQIVAENIQAVTGGDLFSIQTSVAYPGNIDDLIDYAAKEQSNRVMPELTAHIENLNQYDTVFVGYPLWWYDLPQVMYSFFEEYDFSGKTIIPFDVHNGSRLSGTVQTIQELESNATVISDGFTVAQNKAADSASEVENWLHGLNY